MRGHDPGPPEPLSAEREAEIRRDARGKLWSKHGGNERGYPTHRRALRDLLTEIARLRTEVERLVFVNESNEASYLQARAAYDKNLAALRAEVERLTNEGIDSDAAEAMEQTWRAKYDAARADADRMERFMRLRTFDGERTEWDVWLESCAASASTKKGAASEVLLDSGG